jgi:Xaa-Pro aminopeptidase
MDVTLFRKRRAALAQQLRDAGGGVALLGNAPEHFRSGDSHYPYRANSQFHYLSGFEEPESWLAVCSSGHSILFCRSINPERAMWEGCRLGPQAAQQTLHIDEAHPVDALPTLLPQLLTQHRKLWTMPAGMGPTSLAQLGTWLADMPQCAQHDLTPLVSEMQLIKDSTEMQVMRRAASISAGAHARVMRFCMTQFQIQPQCPIAEYAIEAELLHEFRRHGAQGPAYNSVVAAGGNACVLHHQAGDTGLYPGQLCLIDAGCELEGYASDISRTFPANGRFTSAQRTLYDIVLAAQEAAIAHTRPGARLKDAHYAAVRVLAQGMLDTGLLQREKHGYVDDVIHTAAYRRFYMHGTGHWLGRDVHDVGEYLSEHEDPIAQPDGMGNTVVKKPSRHLAPGMVVTIEPGLYVQAAADVPERYWNMGLRIEDDAIITATGCELISRGVPVRAREIETLMAGS